MLFNCCFADIFSGNIYHDDVIKWKHFPRYWPFVRGIHRKQVNSLHKVLWRGALMFSLICARINVWVNNGEAGDLRRHCTHYDVIVIIFIFLHRFFTLRECRWLKAFLVEENIHLSCIVNAMDADAPATKRARASTTRVLTKFSSW